MTNSKKKLVLLGASGYIGRYAVDFFSPLFQVFGFTRNTANSTEFCCLNFTNSNALMENLKEINPHYIVNLAGSKNSCMLNEALQINADIPLQLMMHASNLGNQLQKIIFIGSAAEYGNTSTLPITENTPLNPINNYGLSKTIQTTYFRYFAQHATIPMCLLRPFNIIDAQVPNHIAVGAFIEKVRAIQKEGTIDVRNIDVKRDFVSRQDLCKAIQLILLHNNKSTEYNIASNRSYSLESILQFLIAQSGKKIHIVTSKFQEQEKCIMDSKGSYEKIYNDCGWQPSETVFDVLRKITWN